MCWAWGKCGLGPPLVFLEVELGDRHGLFGGVGEADGPVGLKCCAEEPARAGGRLEAGGGAAVREDEGETLVLILVLTQVGDVHCLEAKTGAVRAGEPRDPVLPPSPCSHLAPGWPTEGAGETLTRDPCSWPCVPGCPEQQ